jgi:hypothetical protein
MYGSGSSTIAANACAGPSWQSHCSEQRTWDFLTDLLGATDASQVGLTARQTAAEGNSATAALCAGG